MIKIRFVGPSVLEAVETLSHELSLLTTRPMGHLQGAANKCLILLSCSCEPQLIPFKLKVEKQLHNF